MLYDSIQQQRQRQRGLAVNNNAGAFMRRKLEAQKNKIKSKAEFVIGRLSDETVVAVDQQQQNQQREMERMVQMVEEARQLSLKLIREYLVKFLKESQHPDEVTYTEWIANLHPENATFCETTGAVIDLDYRFFTPGNPWVEVYEQITTERAPRRSKVVVPSHSPNLVRSSRTRTPSQLIRTR